MALAVHQALMAPFAYDWATLDSHDDRPFGSAKSMMAMSVVYLMSLTVLRLVVGKNGCAGPVLKQVERVNNLFMSLYSGYTFVGVVALLIHNWSSMNYDPVAPFCDGGRRLLDGMDFWFYTFYVSKFWEWIDTWLLIAKGKGVWPPENSQYFLHVFHHTTTASIAWLAWKQEFSIAWIGPLTNSFVHTPMYAYYLLSSITPKVRKYGVFITPIQILQFILCLSSMIPEIVGKVTGIPEVCSTGTTVSVSWMFFTYSVFLYLFVKMFSKKKAIFKEAKKKSTKIG